jgi:hypothetical protein
MLDVSRNEVTQGSACSRSFFAIRQMLAARRGSLGQRWELVAAPQRHGLAAARARD